MHYDTEIAAGDRFAFGDNWRAFLSVLDQERIDEAGRELSALLGRQDLSGLTFLDLGSGSGIHSLAAHRLGARVTSVDYDQECVNCAKFLRSKYAEREDWTVRQGSALDDSLPSELGRFDIVYSWGVLHHTGNMAKALDVSASMVRPGGDYAIALYNDQGALSTFWLLVKRLFNKGLLPRLLVKMIFYPYFGVRGVAAGLVRHAHPFGYFLQYRKQRGMSIIHDWDDWLGGLPFEVARPGEIEALMRAKGMRLVRLISTNKNGNNQFLFTCEG